MRERSVKVRRQVVGATIAVSGLLILLVPLVTTLVAGEDAYTEIRRAWPGTTIAVTATVLAAAASVAAFLTFGGLIHEAIIRVRHHRRDDFAVDGTGVRVARIASALWSAASGLLIFVTALDSSGVGVDALGSGEALAYGYTASYFPGAWTVTFLFSTAIAIVLQVRSTWTSLVLSLWMSGFAALAPVVVGQVLVGWNHDFGGDATIIQTLAVDVVLGACAVAGLAAAGGARTGARERRRLWTLVVLGSPFIVLPELVITPFKLAGTGLLDTATGWQIATRWVALAVVAGALVGLARVTAFARRTALWAAMFVGVGGWLALTVAMTRVPPPNYFENPGIEVVFLGFETPDAPTWLGMLTHWRINILFTTLAVFATVVYLVGVHVVRSRGDRWPRYRVMGWISGWVTVFLATSSGLGFYAGPDFGIHMIVHMTLNMAAPIMLVLGGPITLALRATQQVHGAVSGPHQWTTWLLQWPVARAVMHPLFVFVLYVGSYYALYFTPLFGDLMRYHWGHQFMYMHFLIVGYMFYSMVIGVDMTPRPIPHVGKLGYVIAAMPFHAFFGVIVMTSPKIIAETFYQYLDLPWADLASSQYLGGGVAWAGGELPLLFVVVVLGLQWAKQDTRESRRSDRQEDTGLDTEYEAYNAMLQQLSHRRAPQPATAGATSGTDRAEATAASTVAGGDHGDAGPDGGGRR